MSTTTTIETVVPGLHVSPPESLGFAPQLGIRAELLRDLDFEVLVPGIARLDEPHHQVVEPDEGRRRIGAILERVRAGEDG